MTRLWTPFTLLAALIGTVPAIAQDTYPEHPDSKRQDGVPQGKIEGPFPWKSTIFPGTVRDYWVYVPAQYDGSKPACVMVVQDGLGLANGWKVPTVLDNLIHKKGVPVTIGIFVSPGVVPAPHDKAQPRFNRSFEYDGLGDRYARFLIEEILPEVGKTYKLSQDPNDRAIAGSSSGGIAAFTAAWERPDAFRRVFTGVGTYVGLRGGNEYPVLIRKSEPKPIRVFLQDGSNDNNIYAGSWWVANQDMLAALEWAGYDVNHAWGEGGHNGKHATAILPDALRWLWRDYPQPVAAAPSNKRIEVLIPGENWQLVSEGHGFTEGPAVSPAGDVYFTDIPKNRIHKIDPAGKVTVFAEETNGANGLMFGPDGQLYACQNNAQRIVRYNTEGQHEVVVTDAPSNDLVLLKTGGGYFTDPGNKKVWHFTLDGTKQLVAEGIEFPNGVIPSADQTLLFVNDTRGRWITSWSIQPDGMLANRQEYGWLHRPDHTGQTGADGMTVDTEGRLYVTTNLGVQVLDQLGRVHYMLEKPDPAWLSNAVFAGPEKNILYVTCGGKVFKRKLNATGVIPWQDPVTPPKPRL